ncbi:phosphatidylinositol n-acetylglucosaminyltransferase subunit h [Anaeramoeba flamelloides]|uniref:Phosphatidylinositol n-acetylglucosaminyltransferase subunit h n=1 Tax=Anaeramoeba flamelloides TaxID=1746091 RepID=A0AAV7Y3H4_9EUKA|nr:phosphatidylinositol n-acetylglucosaminyltransferase subunit h [Anaeramoeba flamelloides]
MLSLQNLSVERNVINDDAIEFKLRTKNKLFQLFDKIFVVFALLLLLMQSIVNQKLMFGKLTIILIIVPILRVFVRLFFVCEESLLLIRGMGIQLKKKCYNGSTSIKFLEKAKIQDVVINEGYYLQQTIYYLAFMVEGEKDLVLPFESLYPHLPVLLLIYKKFKKIIMEEQNN